MVVSVLVADFVTWDWFRFLFCLIIVLLECCIVLCVMFLFGLFGTFFVVVGFVGVDFGFTVCVFLFRIAC